MLLFLIVNYDRNNWICCMCEKWRGIKKIKIREVGQQRIRYNSVLRFRAPWVIDDEVRVDSKLNKGRVRIKICTPRNNQFINRHAAAPHVDCAANSNTDFILISDPSGSGSDVAMYSSKAEALDSNITMKIMMREISHKSWTSYSLRLISSDSK